MDFKKITQLIGHSHKKKAVKETLAEFGFELSSLDRGERSAYALFYHPSLPIELCFLVEYDFERYYGEPQSEVDDYSSENYFLIKVDISERHHEIVSLPFQLDFDLNKDELLKQIENNEKSYLREVQSYNGVDSVLYFCEDYTINVRFDSKSQQFKRIDFRLISINESEKLKDLIGSSLPEDAMSSNSLVFFPSGNDVFNSKIEEHSKVLFPICSIKLSTVNKDWGDSFIHFIHYNEDPYNKETVPYYNDYCEDNKISFDIIEGKYEFKSDLRYFDLSDDWKEWFEETKQSYNEKKSVFFNNPKEFNSGVVKIGGKPKRIQGNETPLDPDGNRMSFVASVYTSKLFPDSCPKDMYLFYSEKYQLAVQVYQIS